MFTKEQKRVLVLSSIGNALEFYDFVIFAILASVISKLFFPSSNSASALLAWFAIFAVGYLIRPLGGIIFGHYGDKLGRKKTYLLTIFLMAMPTFLIGCLPTYETVGFLAPILLLSCRVLQGFAIGGEMPGAIVFVSETIMQNYRGLAVGCLIFGSNMGIVLGSIMAMIVFRLTNAEHAIAWAWRIPFWCGGILGIVGFYLRMRLQETAIFSAIKQKQKTVAIPIIEILKNYPKQALQGTLLAAAGGVCMGVFYLYLPSYLTVYLGYKIEQIMPIAMLNTLICSPFILLASYLSDKFGRKKIITIGLLFVVIFGYPVFFGFNQHNLMLIMLLMTISYIFVNFIVACIPVIAESFPTDVRYSGMALGFNLGLGVLGGLTPLVATALINTTNNLLAPSYILIAIGLIALIVLATLQETYKKSLSD